MCVRLCARARLLVLRLRHPGGAGIAAARQSAVGTCGTGAFQVFFFGVRSNVCVCTYFSFSLVKISSKNEKFKTCEQLSVEVNGDE